MRNKNSLLCFLVLFTIFFTLSCRNEANPESPEVRQREQEKVEHAGKTSEKKMIEDRIQVISPRPNTKISSPLQIKGKARGNWFFEGDFPVRLFDDQGKEIAVAIATAQGEWMTEEWVNFEAGMAFEAPASGKGVLVFEKSNPSDIRELDREFRVEVRF